MHSVKTLEFIEKVKQKGKHILENGSLIYDYSLVNYLNNYTKIIIICDKHGEFYQTPNNHLRGTTCKKCSNEKAYLTTKQFISEAINMHGDLYDYTKTIYTHSKKDVEIICKKHGIFSQRPDGHIAGFGCPECSTRTPFTYEKFIDKSLKKHGSIYDYSLVTECNSTTYVNIICKKHGIFRQRAQHHASGANCPQCSSNSAMGFEQFVSRSNKMHSYTYCYNEVNYVNSYTNVKIKCPKHGFFTQSPRSHLNGHGCSECKGNYSNGEKLIISFLENHNIDYIKEYKFKDCYYKRELRFDFYIPSYNLCIEFDGKQHFQVIDFFGGEDKLNYVKVCDEIKNDYCNKSGINLIRISHKYLNKIDEILKNNLIQ